MFGFWSPVCQSLNQYPDYKFLPNPNDIPQKIMIKNYYYYNVGSIYSL
jgi:hypothetical protein